MSFKKSKRSPLINAEGKQAHWNVYTKSYYCEKEDIISDQEQELLTKPWYISVDITEYVARIIESINHDSSISQYLDPYEKIKTRVKKYVDEHKNS